MQKILDIHNIYITFAPQNKQKNRKRMKKRLFCVTCVISIMLLGATSTAHATYRLKRVTTLTTDGLYVFEQCGQVMTNSINTKNQLLTTGSFNTTGLSGSETYVWELRSGSGGYKMYNSHAQNNYHLTGSNTFSWDNSSNATVWSFTLQSDGTFTIKNGTLYLSYYDVDNYKYKVYEMPAKYAHPHSIIVYQLIEEAKTSPALSFDKKMVKFYQGESYTLPVLSKATGHDGEIIYSSSNEQVATVNATTGEVEIVGTGRTLITASTTATDTYDEGEAVYSLVVMGGNGTAEHPYLADDFFTGYTPNYGGNKYVKGYLAGYYTSEPSFSTTATDNDNVALCSSLTEVSVNNTIPICIDDAGLSSSFGLKAHPELLNHEVLIKGQLGTYYQKTTISSASAITVTACPVNITDAKYATYHTAYKLDYSGTAVTPYTAALSGSNIVLTPVSDGIVPANKGIILYSETTGMQSIPVTSASATIDDTGLKISDGATAVGDHIYVLGKKNDIVGFYRWASGSSLSAGRVYLDGSGASAPDFLEFIINDTDLSGIHATTVEPTPCTRYYDLQGRCTTTPRHGVYITNGKKVVVR